jgi:hypothetical protein
MKNLGTSTYERLLHSLLMSNVDTKKAWQSYCSHELDALTPILGAHGYVLDAEQKHMQGERYLMQAITTTSGKKLILTGTSAHGVRVIIKASRDASGILEINHERSCRTVLKNIDFAGSVFHTPEELLYVHEAGFVISVQKFIEQEVTFLERPIEAQCSFALRAFKAQESTHATTAKHRAVIGRTFGIRTAKTYLHVFHTFVANITIARPNDKALHILLDHALKTLREHERTIEQYTGFLTHTDFVPHNIRIQGDTIYLLDHSSLTFGNKYEGWARFLNFMTLYNPPLTELLTQYVQDNRTPEESVALRMMRIYRLGEIIWYYVQTLEKSEGDLHTLNTARVHFWSTVLTHILKDEKVPESVILEYTKTRDSLRSEDEKKRQQGLH